MTDEQFRTNPDNAQPSAGWTKAGAVWITCEPLYDETEKLYARLVYDDAEHAARALGGRLPTPHELDVAMLGGLLIKPVTLYVDERSTHLMMSRAWCAHHDEIAEERADKARLDDPNPFVHIASIGKHWVRGHDAHGDYPPAYWAALYGWYRSRTPGDMFQPLNDGRPKPLRHGAANYVDYSMTTHVVRETEPPT